MRSKTLKTLIASLLFASLAAQVHAAPASQPTGQHQEQTYMDRASQNYDGGGY